jgi:hypothetical protein
MKRKIPLPDKGTPYEQQATADAKWAENSHHLRRKYKGQIIAVWKQKVVAAARTLLELKSKLVGAGHYPPTDEKSFVAVSFRYLRQ